LTEAASDLDEFQEVNPPFSRLDLPHERVRTLEFAGELSLSQAGRLSGLNDRRY
jgi:hypothetical protein